MPPSAIHMDHVRSQQQNKHLHAAALERQGAEPAGESKDAVAADKGEGMSFWDVLDVVNPLQHIPVVNKIYQAVTGDTIRAPAKIAGAALFFGPVGLAMASVDAVVEKQTGRDMLGNVASALGLEQDAAPVEDDPFTVTAQRPAKVADATPAPAALPTQATATVSAGPVELSAGQAALLESLMGSQGAAPVATPAVAPTPAPVAATIAPPAVVATSATARAPAAGGIATAQQLKELESTPGASAALTAARGMGSAAIVASLPAPGSAGAGDNLLAAMSQEQDRSRTPNMGKGLAEYRAAAVSAGGMQVKPLVPSTANQMVRNAGANMPGANVARNPALTTRTAAAPMPAPAAQPAAAPATQPAQAPDTASAAWPPSGPTPLPKELVADMMAQAMNKYEAQSRRANATTAAAP